MNTASKWSIRWAKIQRRTSYESSPLTSKWANVGVTIGSSFSMRWSAKASWTLTTTFSFYAFKCDRRHTNRNVAINNGIWPMWKTRIIICTMRTNYCERKCTFTCRTNDVVCRRPRRVIMAKWCPANRPMIILIRTKRKRLQRHVRWMFQKKAKT